MEPRAQSIIFVVILLLVLGFGGWWWYTKSETATSTPPIATSTPPRATTTPGTASVKIAVLDTSGTSNGKPRGCGKVLLIETRVATTTAPLTSALQHLFSLSTTTVSGYFNFIARTNATLKFSRAEIQSGTAHIYLTGSLSGLAGVCDDPRASIQIEETALQFSTVQRVQLYLNNATTTLVPSQQ